MDKEIAESMLDQIARNLMAINKLSNIIDKVGEVQDRKLYTPVLKELLSSNYELQLQIGHHYPDLDPMLLGLENFTSLRKKYEDPEYPVRMPPKEELDKARTSWLKIQKKVKK